MICTCFQLTAPDVHTCWFRNSLISDTYVVHYVNCGLSSGMYVAGQRWHIACCSFLSRLCVMRCSLYLHRSHVLWGCAAGGKPSAGGAAGPGGCGGRAGGPVASSNRTLHHRAYGPSCPLLILHSHHSLIRVTSFASSGDFLQALFVTDDCCLLILVWLLFVHGIALLVLAC